MAFFFWVIRNCYPHLAFNSTLGFSHVQAKEEVTPISLLSPVLYFRTELFLATRRCSLFMLEEQVWPQLTGNHMWFPKPKVSTRHGVGSCNILNFLCWLSLLSLVDPPISSPIHPSLKTYVGLFLVAALTYIPCVLQLAEKMSTYHHFITPWECRLALLLPLQETMWDISGQQFMECPLSFYLASLPKMGKTTSSSYWYGLVGLRVWVLPPASSCTPDMPYFLLIYLLTYNPGLDQWCLKPQTQKEDNISPFNNKQAGYTWSYSHLLHSDNPWQINCRELKENIRPVSAGLIFQTLPMQAGHLWVVQGCVLNLPLSISYHLETHIFFFLFSFSHDIHIIMAISQDHC